MNQEPKVSVIIPVYNTEQYLRQCLDSVIAQTLREIEIICVDDGSTDASLAILREYEEKDGRVKVLTQPNINAGAARNNGLCHAAGEYLSFLDADDLFEPDMLEKAYRQAKEQEAEICVFSYNFFTDEGESFPGESNYPDKALPEQRPFSGLDAKDGLFGLFVGWAWDKLFLREFVTQNEISFQEQRTTNDLLFTYFALAKAQRITVLDEVLAHHRTRVKSSLEATRSKSWDCFYKALLALREALVRAGLYEPFERAFANYCLTLSLWNLNTIDWPVQESLYYHLKLTWFKDLDVVGHDEAFFYNPHEYTALNKVLLEPYWEESPRALTRRLEEQQARVAELESRVNELKKAVGERDRWLQDLTSSLSYRLGRGITWAPRKVKHWLKKEDEKEN